MSTHTQHPNFRRTHSPVYHHVPRPLRDAYSRLTDQPRDSFHYRHNSFRQSSDSQDVDVSGRKDSYYPNSLALILVWTVCIGGLLYLLETAVKRGATDASLPWIYATAPGLFLTAFAQVHRAVTAAHLARLAVSALDSSWASPNRWIEFFWTANRSWGSPTGIAECIKTSVTKPIRPSLLFCLFALTTIIATATPTILSHAFPISNVAVPVPTTIRPTTFDSSMMTFFDAYTQESVGMGSWVTGLPMAQLYSTSVFQPENVSQSDTSPGMHDPSDFFFAGSIGNVSAVLPGIRFQGGCTPIPEDPRTTGSSVGDALGPTCAALLRDGGVFEVSSSTTLQWSAIEFNYTLCSKSGFSGLHAEPTSNEGYFMYSYATTTYVPGRGIVYGAPGRGLVHCKSTFMTGFAELEGGKQTFARFSLQELFDERNSAHGDEPLGDPMGAAWSYLSVVAGSRSSDQLTSSVVRGFGFSMLPATTEQWTSPSADEMARRLWTAIAHNAAAIGFLSWSNATEYPATKTVFAAVYVHRPPFVLVAYALLSAWLLLVTLLTMVAWRKTFASSLDAYVAAQLAATYKPDLFDSITLSTQLENNAKADDAFHLLRRRTYQNSGTIVSL